RWSQEVDTDLTAIRLRGRQITHPLGSAPLHSCEPTGQHSRYFSTGVSQWMIRSQRGLRRAINSTFCLATLFAVVAQQILPCNRKDVALRSHLTAGPEFPARRDEEIFVSRDAGPFDRLLTQHLFFVGKEVPARVDLLSVAFQLLLLFDEAEEWLACAGVAQDAIVHEIVVDDPCMSRDASVEAGVDHLGHLLDRLVKKHPGNLQFDLR